MGLLLTSPRQGQYIVGDPPRVKGCTHALKHFKHNSHKTQPRTLSLTSFTCVIQRNYFVKLLSMLYDPAIHKAHHFSYKSMGTDQSLLGSIGRGGGR